MTIGLSILMALSRTVVVKIVGKLNQVVRGGVVRHAAILFEL